MAVKGNRSNIDLREQLIDEQEVSSSSSSSSSSSDGDDDDDDEEVKIEQSPLDAIKKLREQGKLDNLQEKETANSVAAGDADEQPALAEGGRVLTNSDDKPVTRQSMAKQRWAHAGKVVRAQARVKLTLGALHSKTRKLREMGERERSWYMTKLFIMLVFLAVMDTETKACAFHISAVGMYSIDGKPYKFSYSLFVALTVFIMKLCLGPLKKLHHKQEKGDKHGDKSHHMGKTPSHSKGMSHESSGSMSRQKSPTSPDSPKKGHHSGLLHSGRLASKAKAICESENKKALLEKVMPWLLLFGFTFAEMMSTTLANYALNCTPTSIYIVFKSSKMVFVAIASRVFLGAKLRNAQWCALLLLVIALLIATVAEKKPNKKGGGFSLQGPIILLASELFHALMLIMQQVAVQNYWPDPMLLVSASAALGIPVTITSMIAAHKMRNPLPPYHPVSDPLDVFVMCSNSLQLTMMLITHLIFHTLMDVSHIVALKHMSSLARSLCDAVKLGIMWGIGKFFWFTGLFIWGATFPHQKNLWGVLAEPWHPNSWLMIPGLMLIGYAMLMFKFRVYLPLRFEKVDGKTTLTLVKDEKTAEEKANPFLNVDTGLDDDFYSAAFNNRKIRHRTKQRMAALLENMRAEKKPANKLQAVVAKYRMTQKMQAGDA